MGAYGQPIFPIKFSKSLFLFNDGRDRGAVIRRPDDCCGEKTKHRGLLFFQTSVLYGRFLNQDGLDLPSEGAGTEYGGFRPVQSGDKQFGFSAEDRQYVLVVSFFKRFHEQVARLGQSAEEDESFWA